jgi:hypothetical protein
VVDDLSNALEGFIAAQETPVQQVELPPGGRRTQQIEE